jgi:hypothetical protein
MVVVAADGDGLGLGLGLGVVDRSLAWLFGETGRLCVPPWENRDGPSILAIYRRGGRELATGASSVFIFIHYLPVFTTHPTTTHRPQHGTLIPLIPSIRQGRTSLIKRQPKCPHRRLPSSSPTCSSSHGTSSDSTTTAWYARTGR